MGDVDNVQLAGEAHDHGGEIKNLSTILAVYDPRNWTILAIYVPRIKREPFWLFMAPEIINSWQFMAPETAPFW